MVTIDIIALYKYIIKSKNWFMASFNHSLWQKISLFGIENDFLPKLVGILDFEPIDVE